MITLTDGETFVGQAGAATTVTVTVYGDEVTLSTGASVYKVLYQGQPSGSLAILATVGAGLSWLISSIHCVNEDASARTIKLAVKGTAATNTILPAVSLAAGAFATYDSDGWKFFDSAGILQVSGGGSL